MGGNHHEEVSLAAAKKALKGYKEIHGVLEYWVTEKGWRIVGQGHKFALWPPNPGFRLVPPWVRIDGTPSGDRGNSARAVQRACTAMDKLISDQQHVEE